MAAALDVRKSSLSLTVDDLERSIRFYEAIGFAVKERWEDGGKLLGVGLVAGACNLGLSQDDFAKGRGRTKGVGTRLWLEVEESLDAVAERLRAAGFEVEGPDSAQWGVPMLALSDPDGFKLTIHHDMPEA